MIRERQRVSSFINRPRLEERKRERKKNQLDCCVLDQAVEISSLKNIYLLGWNDIPIENF